MFVVHNYTYIFVNRVTHSNSSGHYIYMLWVLIWLFYLVVAFSVILGVISYYKFIPRSEEIVEKANRIFHIRFAFSRISSLFAINFLWTVCHRLRLLLRVIHNWTLNHVQNAWLRLLLIGLWFRLLLNLSTIEINFQIPCKVWKCGQCFYYVYENR